jgi:hypothetical protein
MRICPLGVPFSALGSRRLDEAKRLSTHYSEHGLTPSEHLVRDPEACGLSVELPGRGFVAMAGLDSGQLSSKDTPGLLAACQLLVPAVELAPVERRPRFFA